MLTELLPGLRDVRTAIASGYLWLALGWLAFGAGISDAGPPVEDLIDLGASLSAIGLGVVATFAAYLIGSLSEDVFVRWVIKEDRWLATAADVEPHDGEIQRLADEELVRQELTRLENSLGRTESEARLRITLIPPLLAMFVYLAIDGDSLWLLGVVGLIALGWQTWLRYEEWCQLYARVRDFRDTHDLMEPFDMGSGS